jgi:hypothetical protein
MNLTKKQEMQIRKRFAILLKTKVSQIILCDATFSRKAEGCGLEWWVVTCQVENSADEKVHRLYVGILPDRRMALEFVAIGIYEEAEA